MPSFTRKKSANNGKFTAKSAQDEDDFVINKYSKLLKLNKKKKGSLTKVFRDDGLDYILDVVDRPYNISNALLQEDKKDLSDKRKRNHDSDDEVTEISSKPKRRKELVMRTKQARDKVQSESQSSDEGESAEEDESSNDDDTEVDSEEDPEDNKGSSEESESEEQDIEDDGDNDDEATAESGPVITKKKAEVGLKEDIYGRIRNSEGHIVHSSKTYTPPAKRSAPAENILVKLKGLINRLSENNLQSISNQIESLFMRHCRAEMCDALTQILLGACAGVSLVPDRLIQEHSLLLAVLHSNQGSHVGASFLQSLAERLDNLMQGTDSVDGSKEMNNIISIVCTLYNLKVIQSTLVFDLLNKFLHRFAEQDIEMVLLILKDGGFTLRKDNPAALKAFIHSAQEKAATVTTDKSRIRFMLELITNIKNNNMRKIPGYDPSRLEHLRKLLRNFSKGSHSSDVDLNMTLDDLINSKDKGKWWLVGSAWSGVDQSSSTAVTEVKVPTSSDSSRELLTLAHKQKMNTDVRKQIFCTVLSSQNFLDAFEKCLRLNLTTKQEPEIVRVVVHLCLKEKVFNPFYAFLCQKLCDYHRRLRMALQFTCWDYFKDMVRLSECARTNLAKLLEHLLTCKSISLSVLKVLDFGGLDPTLLSFLRTLLTGFLTSSDQDTVQQVFLKVTDPTKLRGLREGLGLFLQHFLTHPSTTERMNSKQIKLLAQRVELIMNLPGFSSL